MRDAILAAGVSVSTHWSGTFTTISLIVVENKQAEIRFTCMLRKHTKTRLDDFARLDGPSEPTVQFAGFRGHRRIRVVTWASWFMFKRYMKQRGKQRKEV